MDNRQWAKIKTRTLVDVRVFIFYALPLGKGFGISLPYFRPDTVRSYHSIAIFTTECPVKLRCV